MAAILITLTCLSALATVLILLFVKSRDCDAEYYSDKNTQPPLYSCGNKRRQYDPATGLVKEWEVNYTYEDKA